ncbi:limonene hydroxylase [Paenibacillus chondroitinus]|uniref:Limonene hydroxylase n=1 Tax=Paenibacillus chondroitinus TaxID=59842 RepID=A0ABU6DKW5_9BACL|nr:MULTISPECIES: limonene hydroxylase [Paenibacillus]MCY9660966.1 limonene hydroxylase [Paenibacillus anseongense]MEB4797975.1 limonene hydroxylase [Paenibacillus chondroitinus]
MVIYLSKIARPLWEGKTSIYSFIKEQGETAAGALPDDEEFWSGSKLRWVAGGLDGAFGHHAGPGQMTEETRELVHLLAKQSRKPKSSIRKTLYATLVKTDIGSKIDFILEELRKQPGIQPDALFQEARWLAENGAHRNVVKLGIALLGLFQNENVRDLLLTLGRHEEFTLYAAVAIQNGMEDSNQVLFELAKHVHGWGKINLVERLEPATEEIKDWLLRQGCQNSVMNEYLACICARNGGLQEALSANSVDSALFDGATDIVEALLNGGPAEDIYDYEYGPQVVSDYVRLAREMGSSAKHLSVVWSIRDFLDQDEKNWSERMSEGWTEQVKINNRDACELIITDAKWVSIIMDAVSSGNSSDRYYGAACADKLGVDIWETLYGQLAADPLQDFHYFQLMKSSDPNRIRQVVQFATEHLPLQHIAAGPGDEMGFGQEYVAHRNLDTVLQSLDQHEGIGVELILTGLNSPVTRNRNMAIKALEGWHVTAWDERLIHAVNHLSEIEPDDSVKERIQKLREDKRF